jgi:4-oxalocrotonate tautomerase
MDTITAEAGIHETLRLYFDGLYMSDTGRLAQAFHPEARYVCATGGAFVNLGMAEYLPIVAARVSPESRGEVRRDRVLSIELAGPVTAAVRVECSIGPKFFTDLLTMIRLDGRWQIIAKVFHHEPLPEAA